MKKEKKLNHPSVYRIISIIIIAILAVLFTFPLYWIITGSFKTSAAINSTTPIWWPQEWTPGKLLQKPVQPSDCTAVWLPSPSAACLPAAAT